MNSFKTNEVKALTKDQMRKVLGGQLNTYCSVSCYYEGMQMTNIQDAHGCPNDDDFCDSIEGQEGRIDSCECGYYDPQG